METRKPSLISAIWGQQIWAFALMVLAGIGLGAIKYGSYKSAVAFAENGVEVVGDITNMSDYTSSKRKTFRISYTFASEADPYQTGMQSVSQSFYEAQTDGGPITVIYLPNDPAQNLVDLTKLSSGFGVAMLAALGLILGGTAGGYFAVQRARRMRC